MVEQTKQKISRAEWERLEQMDRGEILALLFDLKEQCGYDQEDQENFVHGLLATLANSLTEINAHDDKDDLLPWLAGQLCVRPMVWRYEEPED